MVHFLAPIVLVVTVFMGFAVLPMGRNMQLVDMDAGLLFFFAMGAATELSVFMAGWSSRNKYSLLGAMRAVAQMISYEVVLLLSAVSVVMISGSLSLTKIVAAQDTYSGIFPHWYIFTPWGLAAFVMYAIAGTAETNRSPFDLPEGESETGGRVSHGILRLQIRALLSRRVSRHVFHLRPGYDALSWWMVCAVLVSHVHSFVDLVFRKVLLSIFVFIWMRGTLPRLRQDQLMNFAWKFVLPFTLLDLLVTALWRFMGEGWARWVVCTAILVAAYVMGRVEPMLHEKTLRAQELSLCRVKSREQRTMFFRSRNESAVLAAGTIQDLKR